MSLQDSIIGALGGSTADAETINLVEQIIRNEANGLTGVPSFSFLPSFGTGGQAQGGFGISILNPYLRTFVFQQEHPIVLPLVALGIAGLAIYGLTKLIEPKRAPAGGTSP